MIAHLEGQESALKCTEMHSSEKIMSPCSIPNSEGALQLVVTSAVKNLLRQECL